MIALLQAGLFFGQLGIGYLFYVKFAAENNAEV
jgi:hypothetical protein